MCATAALLALCATLASAQAAPSAGSAVLKPGANLVTENIPPIPMSIVDAVRPYTQSRAAALADWSPTDRSMLITTRFGETAQVHRVAMPGGARTQLTFFPDRVQGATFLPDGKAFLILKDTGGNEWSQIYRQDLDTGKLSLLTDGKSRHSAPLLAHNSSTFAYGITRQNSGDSELWIADARDPAKAHKLLDLKGGGWAAASWSPDNKRLLVEEYLSANNSNLYLVDASTGEKKLLTPHKGDEQVSYAGGPFSADGRSVYVKSDRDNEFERLGKLDLATLSFKPITTAIPWNVEGLEASEDGKHIAFTTNENGTSKLYLLDPARDTFKQVAVPEGVIGALSFHRNGRDLGMTINRSTTAPDVYSVDIVTGKLDRWTESELGGLNPSSLQPSHLITWKSFDGMPISGYMTAPDAAKFPGKRPVIISIHGGPEGQTRPGFPGANAYFTNELGIVRIEPNVRGSTGYGKTFLASDNGMNRDKTFKDIAALLDWIAAQPNLDKDRVMVEGGSYGGLMTWAVAAFYNDRIRCAIPVVGPSNMVTLLEHTEAYRRDLRRVEYGDERDPAMRAYMEKWAAANHTDAMHKPVFAIVGRNDPRVPWTESRQVVDKLEKQGTPIWFLIANDEGHGYAKRANRDFQFAAEVLFVQKYLLDGVTPPITEGTR